MKVRKIVGIIIGSALSISALTGSLIASDINQKKVMTAHAEEIEPVSEAVTIVNDLNENQSEFSVEECSVETVINSDITSGGDSNQADISTQTSADDSSSIFNPSGDVIVNDVVDSSNNVVEVASLEQNNSDYGTQDVENIPYIDASQEYSEYTFVEAPKEVDIQALVYNSTDASANTAPSVEVNTNSVQVATQSNNSELDSNDSFASTYYSYLMALMNQEKEELIEEPVVSSGGVSTSSHHSSNSNSSVQPKTTVATTNNNLSQLTLLQSTIDDLTEKNSKLSEENKALTSNVEKLEDEVAELKSKKDTDNSLFDSYFESPVAEVTVENGFQNIETETFHESSYINGDDSLILNLQPDTGSYIEANISDDAIYALNSMDTVSVQTIKKSTTLQNLILASIVGLILCGAALFVYFFGKKNGWFDQRDYDDVDDILDEEDYIVYNKKIETEEDYFNEGFDEKMPVFA